MKPVVVLVTLLTATAVVLLCTPMAEARKKHQKHHRHAAPAFTPAFNVVRCIGGSCTGTAANDFLIGTNSGDFIEGLAGNDVYQGNGGSDIFFDDSTASNDTYVFNGPLGTSNVFDCGGGADTVDLSSTSFRVLENVTFSRDNLSSLCPGPSADDLILTGPEGTVIIFDHYGGPGKVETIKFANGTLTF